MDRPVAIAAVLLGIFALIIVPFLFWGGTLEEYARTSLASPPSKSIATLLCVVLLALDVFLPIPSSFVSTAGGYLLGFWGGMLASTAGLTLGCAIGYAMGRAGAPLAVRSVGTRDFAFLTERLGRAPQVWLVIVRPIPVLAEASCFVAGLAGIGVSRFVFFTSLANIGISAVYSAAGCGVISVSAAVFVAFALPGALILASRIFLRDRC